ncbi:MAG: flagellar biosynthetic protein FliQ [Phycisphaerae bacterium]|nr:flagellar biosynthetic protein FliQ [Phycisphaerae bacterium]
MDANYILYLGRHTMETALLLSAPLLIAGLLAGLVISIFQTITSLRDSTLSMVPRLVVMGAATLWFGNWMLQILIRFSTEVFNQIQLYGQ